MSNLNSLYARLGGEEGVIRLVKAYIEALKTLPGAQRLRSLYPEDLSKYELRMTEFLSTWLGGPALYQERHGMPMLRESHRSFAIDGEARDEWMLCMRTALRETVSDEELRLYLEGAFWAHGGQPPHQMREAAHQAASLIWRGADQKSEYRSCSGCRTVTSI